jgi:cytochrome c-type protein NapB
MKPRHQRLALLPLLLVAAFGVVDARSAEQRGRPAAATAIPDSALGFVGASVFSVPVPPLFRANTSDPGERPRLPRAYPGAPPRIPHGIGDFLPITRELHACLGCHDTANLEASGAVALSAAHYRDLRRAPEAARREIAGARYVCVSCHVPTTDAGPLVGNSFGAAARGR